MPVPIMNVTADKNNFNPGDTVNLAVKVMNAHLVKTTVKADAVYYATDWEDRDLKFVAGSPDSLELARWQEGQFNIAFKPPVYNSKLMVKTWHLENEIWVQDDSAVIGFEDGLVTLPGTMPAPPFLPYSTPPPGMENPNPLQEAATTKSPGEALPGGTGVSPEVQGAIPAASSPGTDSKQTADSKSTFNIFFVLLLVGAGTVLVAFLLKR